MPGGLRLIKMLYPAKESAPTSTQMSPIAKVISRSVLTDSLVYRVNISVAVCRQGAIYLYRKIDILVLYRRIAMGTRHTRVDLGDDFIGDVAGRAGDFNRHTQ